MNHQSLLTLDTLPEKSPYSQSLLKPFFNLQTANIIRSKSPFTLIFISLHPFSKTNADYGDNIENIAIQIVNEFLQKEIRKSDILFKKENEHKWVILFPHSGEKEAHYFLKRIFSEPLTVSIHPNDRFTIYLSASIVEIANSKAEYEEVLKKGEAALEDAIGQGTSTIRFVDYYQKREIEHIKVSIIENDELIQHLLFMLLKRTVVDYFELDIQTFQNGEEFLQSNWYQSGHTHLVLINDILPQKNGLEVLHELRSMPNNKKYIIVMMSKRKSEEDMIFAYEAGVDEYIAKPFSVHLVEARIKRLIKRLRL